MLAKEYDSTAVGCTFDSVLRPWNDHMLNSVDWHDVSAEQLERPQVTDRTSPVNDLDSLVKDDERCL